MRKFFLLGLMVLVTVAAGCGYAFRGGQNNLPPDIRSIAIPVFGNRTSEVRIEQSFTDEVIKQFNRSQMVRVVPEGDADAVLTGTIFAIVTDDIAYTRQQTSRRRRVTVLVAVKLVRTDNGRILWQDPRMTQNRTYTFTGSVTSDDTAKRQAIRELAKDMAQSIHDGVFENF